MKIRNLTLLLCSLSFAACMQDDFDYAHDRPERGVVFKLYDDVYEGERMRASGLSESRYDRVEYYIVDGNGGIVDNITIKEDVWYELKDGKLVQCENQ